MLAYLRYFFYLATNWNPRIAFYIIRHEIKGERKYNIKTTGVDELKKLEASGVDIDNASIYMPASYDMLESLLAFVSARKCKHFLDLGCGKGRALCVAAHYGFSKLTGIDISKNFLTAARENIENTIKTLEPKPAYNLQHADAYYFDIPDSCDCVFLFNPFNDVIMSGVAENIKDSLRRNPRTIFILYKNPLHKEFFTMNNFVEIYHKQKLRYLEGIVMVSAAGDEISL